MFQRYVPGHIDERAQRRQSGTGLRSPAAIPACPHSCPFSSLVVPIPQGWHEALTPSRKIFPPSFQRLPQHPPPRRLPPRALLSVGRAIAGQHLGPTRRRRKASSNSPPAFRTSVRSPRMGSGWLVDLLARHPLWAQRASSGLDDRVNQFAIFHPTGKRGRGGGPPGLELGPAAVQ